MHICISILIIYKSAVYIRRMCIFSIIIIIALNIAHHIHNIISKVSRLKLHKHLNYIHIDDNIFIQSICKLIQYFAQLINVSTDFWNFLKLASSIGSLENQCIFVTNKTPQIGQSDRLEYLFLDERKLLKKFIRYRCC